jgi:hypothetical protein
MDNPLRIPPDAQHGRPERGVSLMSKLPCLMPENIFWAVFSAIDIFAIVTTFSQVCRSSSFLSNIQEGVLRHG